MRLWRVRWRRGQAQVDGFEYITVQVCVSTPPHTHWAKLGTLTMTNDDWREFRRLISGRGGDVEFVEGLIEGKSNAVTADDRG